MVVAGVPRSGRSDVIAALTRLLDPAYIRVQPSLADIRRHRGGASTRADDASTVDGSAAPTPPEDQPANATTGGPAGGAAADEPVLAPYAEVEVTLADLDAELEQLCDGSVEPLDVDDQIDDSGNAAFDAKLGVRLCYRVTYDPIADSLEHVVYYPARSDPAAGQYARVPGATRRALPVIVLSAQRPLQLRAEGTLRRLVDDRDASGASEAFRALEQSVATATTSLAAHPTISATVDDVLQVGNLSPSDRDAHHGRGGAVSAGGRLAVGSAAHSAAGAEPRRRRAAGAVEPRVDDNGGPVRGRGAASRHHHRPRRRAWR